MRLTGTARRADEFARLIDSGSRSPDPAMAPMLRLAGALQVLPVGPSPDFRDSLRQRLVAVASVQSAAAPAPATPVADRVRAWSSTWRAQRRLAFAAGGVAAVVVVAGVGIGASRSLPGDPLYDVKRAAEQVQLDVTFGAFNKGKLHLEFARTRLREVTQLVDRAQALAAGPGVTAAGLSAASVPAGPIVSTLHAMDMQTRDGANDLYQAYRGGHRSALAVLNRFTQVQSSELSGVLPALPPTARQRGEQSLQLLRTVSGQSQTLQLQLPSPAAGPATHPRPSPDATPATPAPRLSQGPSLTVPGLLPSGTRNGPDVGPGGNTGTTGSGSGRGTGPQPGGHLPSLLPSLPVTLPSLAVTVPALPDAPRAAPSLIPTAVPSLLHTLLPSLPPLPGLQSLH